jgi:hypothetical protein
MSKMKDLIICAVSIAADRDLRRAIKPGILVDDDEDDTPEMLPPVSQPITVAKIWTDADNVFIRESDRSRPDHIIKVERPSKLWELYESAAEREGNWDVAYVSKRSFRDCYCCDSANSTDNHRKAVEAIMLQLAEDYHAAIVYDHVTQTAYCLSLRLCLRHQSRSGYKVH